MFVDTRSGALRGCVTEFVKGDADNRGPRWPSVGAMLAELAEALHVGGRLGYWQPEIEDGVLGWRIVDDR